VYLVSATPGFYPWDGPQYLHKNKIGHSLFPGVNMTKRGGSYDYQSRAPSKNFEVKTCPFFFSFALHEQPYPPIFTAINTQTMHAFRKRSFLSALMLKMNDAESYKNYKYEEKLHRIQSSINLDMAPRQEYHFKHSGNAGDIIYSLPAIMALAGNSRIHLHLQTGQKGHYGKKAHPLGNLMLNDKMVQMLQPLLSCQPYIHSVSTYQTGDAIDYDLDLIRTYPFPLNRGNISRWYFYLFAVNADLGKPWLFVEPDTSWDQHIVIARSQRYQVPAISYSFLKKYSKKIFVGVEAEWKEMKEMLPDLEYHPVNDFLSLAKVIAGSRLFIGNQSFPFSIAEALKIRRLLEVYHLSPNVSVEGPLGYDFCYQPQFEKLVRRLYEQ
jgi:hypothetical protein